MSDSNSLTPRSGFLPLTNDLVFKVLFERNLDLLAAMLSAVLGGPVVVEAVLNPGIPGDRVGDKLMILDVRVRFRDGRRAFVEMQAVGLPYATERFFAYICREYSSQLGRGHGYDKLTPTIGVVWYARSPQPNYGFHETFQMRGQCTGELYSGALTLHVLQLGLLPTRAVAGETQAERALRLWGVLLRAESPEDLDALVEEEPDMSDAVSRLKLLSEDPEIARLARERDEMEYFHELDMRKIREDGEAAGEARGRAEGKAETVLRLIGLKFGPPEPGVEDRVRAASVSELDRWTERVLFAASSKELFE